MASKVFVLIASAFNKQNFQWNFNIKKKDNHRDWSPGWGHTPAPPPRQRHPRAPCPRTSAAALGATPQGPVPKDPLQPRLGRALHPVASAGVCGSVGPSFGSLTNSSEWHTRGDICFPSTNSGWLFLGKRQLVTNLKANHLNQPVIFFSWNWTFPLDSSSEFGSNAVFVTKFFARKFFSQGIYVQICDKSACGTLDARVHQPGGNELFPFMPHSEYLCSWCLLSTAGTTHNNTALVHTVGNAGVSLNQTG